MKQHLELFQILLSIYVIIHYQMLEKLIVLIQLNALEKMERVHVAPISHQRLRTQQYIIQRKNVFYRRQAEMIEGLDIFINVHQHVLKILIVPIIHSFMTKECNAVAKRQ